MDLMRAALLPGKQPRIVVPEPRQREVMLLTEQPASSDDRGKHHRGFGVEFHEAECGVRNRETRKTKNA
ncbi:hypothetical protein FVF58_33720 [Paraburkholderia panacisoli]|uniref:Uncharacterized protein n=1 Tax=Paraburkholderia panacisoli TaxID=2603818 RepID=A0A5B0GMX3_9BURK|nr:hypothetical protein [Paraburkholderia panacisoli]KAA1004091.1 hypothetical protein FVF58_33720 [Paraburkholderia panacisoli]